MKCFYIVQVFDKHGCTNKFVTSDRWCAEEERDKLQAKHPKMNVEIVTEYEKSIEYVDAMDYDENDLIKEGKE